MKLPEVKESLGDKLCKYCSLEKKGVYGVNGGYVAGCEGSRCDDAYENYLAEHCKLDKQQKKEETE